MVSFFDSDGQTAPEKPSCPGEHSTFQSEIPVSLPEQHHSGIPLLMNTHCWDRQLMIPALSIQSLGVSFKKKITHCFLLCLVFYFVLRERKERRKKDLLFHSFIHSLVDSSVFLDWGSNPEPWRIRIISNQLSYPVIQSGQLGIF